MKRLVLLAMTSVLMTGCSSVMQNSDGSAANPASAAKRAAPSDIATSHGASQFTINDGNGSVMVQKVEMRPGVSSSTVEKLAKRHGCSGSAGAGLITEKGPVEVYRMACDNGKTFTAKCELRQCAPMR
jgi:uncharacterized protein YceK